MIASPDQIARVIHAELWRQAEASPCGDLDVGNLEGDCCLINGPGRVNLVELAIAVMAQARIGYGAIVQGLDTPKGSAIRADREPAAPIHGARTLLVSDKPRVEINQFDATAEVQFEWRNDARGPFNPYDDDRAKLLKDRYLAGERVTLREIGCVVARDWSFVCDSMTLGMGPDTTSLTAWLVLGKPG